MTAAAIQHAILGVPFGGTTGQALVGVTGAAPQWSDTFATAKTIDLGTGALPSSITNPHLRLATVDGGAAFVELEIFGSSNSGIISRKARGTRAAKTAVANNDIIGQFQARGYGTSAYGTVETASMKLLSAEAFTDTAQGGRISLSTITIGTVTLVDRMYIDSNGIGIGALATAGNGLLQLASGTTKANGIAFGTDAFLFRYASAGLLCSGWFKCGDGTQVQSSLLDGTNSGAGGGARFRIQNAGFDIGQIGNVSAFTGSAYDADFGVLANGRLKLYSGNTLAITIDASQKTTFAGNVGFNGTAAIAKPTAAAAATDAATTQTLANSLRTILINYGLAA